MDNVDRAKTAIRSCEQELRDLGAQALKAGKYEAARRIAEVAEALAAGWGRAEALLIPEPVPPSAAASPREPKTNKEQILGEIALKKRRSPADYPQFRRRAEKLIKVGWSKKNKQEYEHNAPWPIVHAVAAHLRMQVRSGRIFNVESVLPIPDSESDGELPSYQIYLTLAWLRSIGLVEKQGRDGYIINRQELSDEALSKHWLSLADEQA